MGVFYETMKIRNHDTNVDIHSLLQFWNSGLGQGVQGSRGSEFEVWGLCVCESPSEGEENI